MALREEFTRSGNWLFRWRSYLPLFLAGLFLVAVSNFRHPYDDPGLGRLWGLGCLLISLVGQGIRMYTIGHVPFGTSGRNTQGQVASVLNTSGMYSLVRHPLYLGNIIIWLGISLLLRSWWFTLIIMLILWVYYERIMFAEEEFLREKFGPAFEAWAEYTPAILPRFRQWRRPELPFSWKTVLRREYSSFFAIVVIFTVLNLLSEFFLHGRLAPDAMWLAIFFLGLTIYLTLRWLKKKTTLLQVAGR
jgi:protein-S-isoprenylcysteine O-methyltransferase Ste14